MSDKPKITRRDRCYLVGKRAGLLTSRERSQAWQKLASMVEAMGESDLPKFNQLLAAIRVVTIKGKQR